jgi:GNAT superfamily N-acetyltransferase
MQLALRPATAEDLAFARRLYLDNMREATERVLVWDVARQTAGFDARFEPGEVSVIRLDGEDIGWMQVAEPEGEFFPKQFFVAPVFQRRGIGTALLRDLVARAAKAGKGVTLGVVKGNPARSLYERHGFQMASEDRYKLYMAKEP